ncbi:NAD(P)/FAD-dependent oxidoreductase [Lacrimispora sp. 210928-DFI.3.58]|uniref:NAD(P)/FAD-dependent oxidoreductase n=1 Tax=Lacrimispora sp. 210928-DFI.3.58 TaxID=2883214 RepID=UPI0015B4A9E2|nr:FAD-dependent oxidoreductase [Lacrimispora sp. 210928-DFI.3.58]MCB7318522.1 FAD-dependent oxidoreductase [Lacrimispora sp. 210928-DFI.3.58]
MERFAIIGFGCAGYHALEAIRQSGSRASVDIYSNTAMPPYNPMLTTYYAAGRLPFEGMFPFGSLEEIASRYDAHVIAGTAVKAVRAADKAVVTEDGTERTYDKILIATGASAFVPGSFGGLKGAFCMRTVEDAVKLHDAVAARHYKNAVVVGASMVGIKVAELLYKQGTHVTLADMAPHIFALAAYPEVSEIIEERIRAMGMDIAFGQAITAAEEHCDEQGNVTGYTVHLGDGSVIETEMLVLNIGTRAATGILDPEEVRIERGIVVDEKMQTSAEGIYAAGDCCQGNNLQSGQTQIIGLWANAGVQGRVAGANMAGGQAETDGNILHNITHFLDMDFIGLGDNRITGDTYTYVNREKGFYLQAVIKDGRPVGFNILDNYGISGILKAHLIKILRGEGCTFTPEQRGQLMHYGLEQGFMDYLEAAV